MIELLLNKLDSNLQFYIEINFHILVLNLLRFLL